MTPQWLAQSVSTRSTALAGIQCYGAFSRDGLPEVWQRPVFGHQRIIHSEQFQLEDPTKRKQAKSVSCKMGDLKCGNFSTRTSDL